jgi:hypothetical protein
MRSFIESTNPLTERKWFLELLPDKPDRSLA